MKNIRLLVIICVPVACVFLFSGYKQTKCPVQVAISSPKMNVLYRHLDNPIFIDVNGMNRDELRVTAEGGTITPAGNQFLIKPTESGTVFINVSAEKDGETRLLMKQSWRVKDVPDPVCFVGSIHDIGTIRKENLVTEKGIFARMVNFDFDMRASVHSFDMTTHRDSGYVTESATGPVFTPKMQQLLNNARYGDRIYIENVKVTMPGNTVRKIPGVTLQVR